MSLQATEMGEKRRGFSGWHVAGIVLLTLVVTVAATFWIVRTYIYPADFEPVQLTPGEQNTLDEKLERLGNFDTAPEKLADETDQEWLRDEPYSESEAERRISFSEKELNALIGKDPDFGRRVAVDLSDNLASARILISIPPDFPIMSGRTIRVNAGMELAYEAGRPIVMLRGVSVMGVPVPNAWLGNLKNVDLVREFGMERGFWKSFADGVEWIRVEDGDLSIQLRE